ncbi:MAG: bifunctional phosphopantothenoylcysteine decarboxylase/phosphopantothenate--cysteine ligase CoaBC [Clostridiales bacterium]|nr:bifunctional phosphopantothenoylcysteine decarboxylase/phosphopantothenate--cysteine ligase CoaBC [Eubacteriales bacterium]MDH7565488.1 bifunctional phosphopantothenoylcysteine decarboxylase/phosphopantothenate--cysteine ligase CoaBC [Clostridiales bacterium]
MLEGKTVVVGVCGGIAAYKVVEVVSKLRKLNAQVHVVMTKNAAEFVTPLTFQTISHNLVVTDMFAEPKTWDIQHISLAEKADLLVVAPATANIIGKVASGIADDMLTTTIMACTSPVMFVPAMNTAMYENPVVQRNIEKLRELGYIFLEPDTGSLACGTAGKGRLPEPEAIVRDIVSRLVPKRDLDGIKIMVTAGPTREAIDPVRYISNHSSGKMGYAVAEAAGRRGAKVRMVSGPVSLPKPRGVEVTYVTSAEEMYREVLKTYEEFQVLIMVAAVADYRCVGISSKKIKKTGERLTLEMTRNPDIAGEMGRLKGNRILVGFSAETDELINNSKMKLESKNLDMIVANDVTQEGAGFEKDTNIVKIIHKDGSIRELPKMSKNEVAEEILDEVVKLVGTGRFTAGN